MVNCQDVRFLPVFRKREIPVDIDQMGRARRERTDRYDMDVLLFFGNGLMIRNDRDENDMMILKYNLNIQLPMKPRLYLLELDQVKPV